MSSSYTPPPFPEPADDRIGDDEVDSIVEIGGDQMLDGDADDDALDSADADEIAARDGRIEQ